MSKIFFTCVLSLIVGSADAFAREMPLTETEIIRLFVSQINNLKWDPANEGNPAESIAEAFASDLVLLVNGATVYESEIGGGRGPLPGEAPVGSKISATCQDLYEGKGCSIVIMNGSWHGYAFSIRRNRFSGDVVIPYVNRILAN